MKKEAYRLHNEAMDIAEQAIILRSTGDSSKAVELFKLAFEKEKVVAMSVVNEDFEPSRSVLFRSAASMAYNAKMYRDAEKMIAIGLAGNPPPQIANDLRDLYENVNFNRHLEVKGVTLGDNQYQLAINGPSIAHGIAKRDEFTKRLDTIKKMTHRTVQRLNKQPFQERGRFPDAQVNMLDLYISSDIRAASFAATIQLGIPVEQNRLFPEIGNERMIIDEIIDGIELVNTKKEMQLKEKFQDIAYFRNFIGLARELAPDGIDINLVGLTAKREKQDKMVAFKRLKQEISPALFTDMKTIPLENQSRTLEIKGILNFADAKKNKIKLTTENNKTWNVIVPDGLGEIVKPYWEEDVIVIGIEQEKNKTVVLQSIDKV